MKANFGIVIAALLTTTPAFAAGYTITPLVSDQAGVAPVQDTGSHQPLGAPHSKATLCPSGHSDNGTSKSTFYDRSTGVKQCPYRSGAQLTDRYRGCYVPSSLGFDVTKNCAEYRQPAPLYIRYDLGRGLLLGAICR